MNTYDHASMSKMFDEAMDYVRDRGMILGTRTESFGTSERIWHVAELKSRIGDTEYSSHGRGQSQMEAVCQAYLAWRTHWAKPKSIPTDPQEAEQ